MLVRARGAGPSIIARARFSMDKIEFRKVRRLPYASHGETMPGGTHGLIFSSDSNAGILRSPFNTAGHLELHSGRFFHHDFAMFINGTSLTARATSIIGPNSDMSSRYSPPSLRSLQPRKSVRMLGVSGRFLSVR